MLLTHHCISVYTYRMRRDVSLNSISLFSHNVNRSKVNDPVLDYAPGKLPEQVRG